MFLLIQEFVEIIWDRTKKGGGLGFSTSFICSLIVLLSEGKITPFHIPFTTVPTEEKLGCVDQTEIPSVVAVVVHNTCTTSGYTITLQMATFAFGRSCISISWAFQPKYSCSGVNA